MDAVIAKQEAEEKDMEKREAGLAEEKARLAAKRARLTEWQKLQEEKIQREETLKETRKRLIFAELDMKALSKRAKEFEDELASDAPQPSSAHQQPHQQPRHTGTPPSSATRLPMTQPVIKTEVQDGEQIPDYDFPGYLRAQGKSQN